MSLYGRVDSAANQTAVGLTRGNGAGSATETIVFVDETEAGLSTNKERGITAPGWWAYRTYTDAAGNTRHKAEHLMFLTNPEANADETLSDDTIAADVLEVITISAHPADVGNGTSTLELPSAAVTTFAVTATADQSGTLAYVWQRKLPDSTRWVNIGAATDGAAYTNFTTATLSVNTTNAAGKWGAAGSEDASVAAYDGIQFRVKITTSKGAQEVTSNAATLRLVNAV